MHVSFSSAGSIADVGHPWLRGDGLFETIRVQGNVPLLLGRHIARMKRSSEALRYGNPDFDSIEGNATDLANSWTGDMGRMRITLFSDGEFLITIEEFSLASTMPAKLGVAKYTLDEGALLAGHKSLSYAANATLLRFAAESGLSDVVVLNKTGLVAESCIANIFAIIDGRVATPPLASGCLPGIARQLLLEKGLASETELPLDQLFNAEALFLTNSMRGVVPVSSLTEKGRIKNFITHPEVQNLAKRLEELFVLESHA